MTQTEGGLQSSHPREFTADECFERLTSTTMGRLAWSAGSLLHILPISYAIQAGNVVFRTSPYGDLAHLKHPANVAFEIDQVDEATGTGWSVVIQGRAQAVSLPQELVSLWAREDIVPWASGTRNLFISVTPHTMTGRTVRAPFAD